MKSAGFHWKNARGRFSRPGALLALICVVSFVFMSWAAWTDSAIYDEVAHIPAGYGYVHDLSYNLNPEHPPLVKELAMITVAQFIQPNFPSQTPAWLSAADDEFALGGQFLYQSSNNANTIVRAARIFPMLITLLAIIFTYLIAQMIVGDWWALIPAFLFALDPTVIAQGHYVTTDLGATAGILASLYFFLRFAFAPTTKNLWLAGIALGIAELTKFSAIALVPLFIFFIFVQHNLKNNSSSNDSSARPRSKLHALYIFLICYGGVVYPAYALLLIHYPMAKQIADTRTLLSAITGGPSFPQTICLWMASHTALRPIAEYLLGLLLVTGRASTGTLMYAFGKVAWRGGWQYFPLVFLLKEPIPTLLFIIGAALIAFIFIFRKIILRRAHLRWVESNERIFVAFSMLCFVAFYWFISMMSPLDLGIRYLLPSFPFIFILATYFWKLWLDGRTKNTSLDARRNLTKIFAPLALGGGAVILLWLLAETFFAAPYFLSYFNEFGGGVWNGYHFVDDSNYDWGQDLLRLQAWTSDHPEVDKIAVDYFGQGNPLPYYFGDKAVAWSSADGDPRAQNIHWLAVSINTLELATQPPAPGVTRNASDTYAWLTALRPPASVGIGNNFGSAVGNVPAPDYRAGTSIFIYHLP